MWTKVIVKVTKIQFNTVKIMLINANLCLLYNIIVKSKKYIIIMIKNKKLLHVHLLNTAFINMVITMEGIDSSIIQDAFLSDHP